MSDPSYPIGKFESPAAVTASQRAEYIRQIEEAPAKLRDAVTGLTEAQLDHPYRDGGWTLRQVAHHLPDSHMNAYIRFKLAVTEDQPVVKTYDEAAWAELPDGSKADVDVSIQLLEALHRRWVIFLRSLDQAQYARAFRHPDMGPMSLDRTLALYAWHGRHHVAQITSCRSRRSW